LGEHQAAIAHLPNCLIQALATGFGNPARAMDAVGAMEKND
jgi:hypothetical protein